MYRKSSPNLVFKHCPTATPRSFNRYEREKAELAARMEEEKDALRERLERENAELRGALDGHRKNLKDNIDENYFEGSRKMADLAEKLAQLGKDHSRGISELERRVSGDRRELEALMAQPLSVYFDAYRTEDYMDGGEDYLTFHGNYNM